MKTFTLILISFFFLSGKAFSQIRIGLRVVPGLGYLKSSNLKKYYQHLEQETPQNDSYNASSRLRSHLSFGGFAEYKVSSNIFIAAEPVITFSSNKIITVYNMDMVDTSGNGTTTHISSEAKIKATYISLPISVKFLFNHRRNLFVFGGLNLNFHFSPHLISKEKKTVVQYNQGIASDYPVFKQKTHFKLTSYHVFNLNPVLGIGKVFNPYGRNIIIDIRYSFPLLKSTLYGETNTALLFNSAFTSEGQKSITASAPRYTLNDFKMGVLSFSVAYTLYKNYR